MSKIVKVGQLYKKAAFKKQAVLVTGVFDILHWAHKEFLKKAEQAGDLLLVGLERNKRVKQLKGEKRPANSQKKRLQNLKELGIADFLFLLPKNFGKPQVRKDFLKKLRPDILAVSESTPNLPDKKKLMEAVDGEVQVVYDHQADVSSTQILNS